MGGPDFERVFIFKAMFPRLDEDVTTNMSHCLKAPFVIHPLTRRCSVPIPDIDKWLPHMAPRASELIPLPPDDKVPAWVQEREARRCALALSEYVQHLALVMHRAYPLPIGQSFLGEAPRPAAPSLVAETFPVREHSEDDGRYDNIVDDWQA